MMSPEDRRILETAREVDARSPCVGGMRGDDIDGLLDSHHELLALTDRWVAGRAAAKELLENLEFAYAYMKNEPGGYQWQIGMERMRVAIAEAKGES